MKSIAIALMLLAAPVKTEATPNERIALLKKEINQAMAKLGTDFKCFTLIDRQAATAIFTCDAGTEAKPERFAAVYVWADDEWAVVNRIYHDL
jgi:glyceraldehyde-3-phosphate dehydrogenase/erythrose-4-phosphate dehydrogenase